MATHPEAEGSLRGDIADMVAIRQQAFRLANTFPQDTPLTDEQRCMIIESLPQINTPNAIAGRLGVFVCNHLDSLDLVRNDDMRGDWQAGDALDSEMNEYLSDLFANDHMLHELGVVALGEVIGRSESGARPSSHADIVTPELAVAGVFLVTRQRMVARFAVRASGRLITVHKRSEFGFDAKQDDDPRQETALRAEAIARGGFRLGFGIKHSYSIDQMGEMHRMLREGFTAKIEDAIIHRRRHLYPLSIGYYAHLRKRSK